MILMDHDLEVVSCYSQNGAISSQSVSSVCAYQHTHKQMSEHIHAARDPLASFAMEVLVLTAGHCQDPCNHCTHTWVAVAVPTHQGLSDVQQVDADNSAAAADGDGDAR